LTIAICPGMLRISGSFNDDILTNILITIASLFGVMVFLSIYATMTSEITESLLKNIEQTHEMKE
jgi:hypothetical protein